jgi:drug/metabolite transporter (DMT)-like permease
VFFGFFPWAFSVALQYTTAARGAIGIATIPIQTLIVAAISGREPLTRRNVLSVALGFAGIATVFGPEAFRGEVSPHWLGDGLMLIGALSAAIYSVFGRPVFGRHGAMFVMVLAVFFGLLTLTLLAAASGVLTSWPTFGGSGWIAVIFLGTLGATIQFSLFTWALRWLPPSRVVIYLTLNLIVAILLASLFLGEPVTPALIAGLALVIGGIFVPNRRAATAGAIDRSRQPTRASSKRWLNVCFWHKADIPSCIAHVRFRG